MITFRAAVGQLAGHLEKEPVVTDHHPKLEEPRLGQRIRTPCGAASRNLVAGQADLSILPDDGSVRSDQYRDVIDELPVPFQQAEDDVPIGSMKTRMVRCVPST